MQREPAIIIGALEAAVIAVIAVIAYLLGWDSEFAALVVGAASALVALFGAVWTRGVVVSPATHDAAVQDALYTPVPGERE